MELKIWTPFFNLEKEMRSMLEPFRKVPGESTLFEFRPTTDVVRENGTLKVTAELPGIDPEKDLEIMIEGDVLFIKGKKMATEEVTEKDRYLRERHFGSFERRIPMPDGVDPDSIKATYDKGVLTVSVPMPQEAERMARKIPINIG